MKQRIHVDSREDGRLVLKAVGAALGLAGALMMVFGLFASGGGSTALAHMECSGPGWGSEEGDPLVTVNADEGNVINRICIQAGGGDEHEVDTAEDGTFLDGCFEVEGIGATPVTVTRIGAESPDCQAISHVDFLQDPEATPTATVETPTATVETPTATVETPTATVETPTATVETPTATVETPTVTVETPTPTEEVAAAVDTPAPTVTEEAVVLAETPIPTATEEAAVLGAQELPSTGSGGPTGSAATKWVEIGAVMVALGVGLLLTSWRLGIQN